MFVVKLMHIPTKFHGDPIKLKATIQKLSNGKFTLKNKQSHLASMMGMNIVSGKYYTESSSICFPKKSIDVSWMTYFLFYVVFC